MLIVNPHATSTTPLRRDVIARALASELDLTVVQTRYRGHAAQFAGRIRHLEKGELLPETELRN